MEGYVKLYRKSLDSSVFHSANLWKVWCYCLMRANHKANKILFEGKELILQSGQFITGRYEGSKACNMKPSTFRDQLYKLKQLKSIDIKSDNKKSIITICNWGFFQGSKNLSDTKSDIRSDNKPTTNRHRQEWKKYNSKNEDEFKLTFEGVPSG